MSKGVKDKNQSFSDKYSMCNRTYQALSVIGIGRDPCNQCTNTWIPEFCDSCKEYVTSDEYLQMCWNRPPNGPVIPPESDHTCSFLEHIKPPPPFPSGKDATSSGCFSSEKDCDDEYHNYSIAKADDKSFQLDSLLYGGKGNCLGQFLKDHSKYPDVVRNMDIVCDNLENNLIDFGKKLNSTDTDYGDPCDNEYIKLYCSNCKKGGGYWNICTPNPIV